MIKTKLRYQQQRLMEAKNGSFRSFNLKNYNENKQRSFAGAHHSNFERGRRYIYNRKGEIIHGLSPRVKCVAPLFRDMFLAKNEMQAGGARPQRPSQLHPGR